MYSKLSRAYVQQEVRKAPQKHLLKGIREKNHVSKTLLTTASKIWSIQVIVCLCSASVSSHSFICNIVAKRHIIHSTSFKYLRITVTTRGQTGQSFFK